MRLFMAGIATAIAINYVDLFDRMIGAGLTVFDTIRIFN